MLNEAYSEAVIMEDREIRMCRNPRDSGAFSQEIDEQRPIFFIRREINLLKKIVLHN
jgi:hypothetical protein